MVDPVLYCVAEILPQEHLNANKLQIVRYSIRKPQPFYSVELLQQHFLEVDWYNWNVPMRFCFLFCSSIAQHSSGDRAFPPQPITSKSASTDPSIAKSGRNGSWYFCFSARYLPFLVILGSVRDSSCVIVFFGNTVSMSETFSSGISQ